MEKISQKAEKEIFIVFANAFDVLCGIAGSFCYLLMRHSFNISQVKDLPVLWINDISFNYFTHVISVISRHNTPPKMSPLPRRIMAAYYFGGSF